MVPYRKYRSFFYALSLSAAVLAGAELLARVGWLQSLENVYYDLWHQMAGEREKPKNVVIATVDDQTLLEYKDEPLAFWGPHFARAIQTLRDAGARVVGIDFLFSVSAESWLKRIDASESPLSRSYDIPLRTQLNSGQVVLIANLVKTDSGENRVLMPVVEYLYALPNGPADVGFSNLYMDEDDAIRRFIPRILEQDHAPREGFSVLLAGRARELAGNPQPPGGAKAKNAATTPEAIGFVGPPGTFPRVSFGKLLRPGVGSDAQIRMLKDKVVIIAAEHAGSPDNHLTPYARGFITQKKALMSGAEIHANIVETILTGRRPQDAPSWVRVLWVMLAVVPGAALFFRIKPGAGAACTLGIGLICAGIAYLSFLNDRNLPLGHVHLSIALCYMGSLGFKFTGGEKTRKRLQQVIGPYVSDTVVEKILSSGKLPELGGESQEVTVLFSDIRNFTAISEILTPQEVVEMLNRYYNLVCEPILGQEGFVDKFVGDAVMAVFGAPVPHADQSRRCILAALEMGHIARDFQNWFQQRFPDPRLPGFRIGIGIHSGKAVVGNIGSAKRMGYTAIGDTTNTASRLESESKRLGWTIVASRKTVKEAGKDIQTGREDVVALKGKKEKIEVVEIIGLK